MCPGGASTWHRVDRPPSSPRTSGPRRRRSTVSAAALLLAAVAACEAPGSGGGDARSGCAAIVAEASEAAEVADQVRLLDDALLTCRSYDALLQQLDRHPGIVGYDTATFVSLRCTRVEDETIRSAPACAAVVVPTTTAPPITVADLVFVGDTLDGRRIEIRPSATVEFAGDVPAVVQQTVDIAIESGCAGVIEQRDRWAAQIDDPVIGDEASVYAQHAQNVADYIQCDVEPLAAG